MVRRQSSAPARGGFPARGLGKQTVVELTAPQADPETEPHPGLPATSASARRHSGVREVHRIRVDGTRAEVTVVRLDGVLDADLLAGLGPTLDALGRPVAVDLGTVTLVDAAAVRGMVDRLTSCATASLVPPPDGRSPVCLVCDRLTGRMLLREWGVEERLPVFQSVGDAVQAHLFADAGYGEGWRRSGDRRTRPVPPVERPVPPVEHGQPTATGSMPRSL